ncbi:hypothetical protein NX059_007219 [Plenodomus lindquistii]|nr:hypothetical protein NX059_007219 [Plenodomus lindquistii]
MSLGVVVQFSKLANQLPSIMQSESAQSGRLDPNLLRLVSRLTVNAVWQLRKPEIGLSYVAPPKIDVVPSSKIDGASHISSATSSLPYCHDNIEMQHLPSITSSPLPMEPPKQPYTHAERQYSGYLRSKRSQG